MANFTTAGSDTYPAGHVLQIQYEERTATWSTGGSGTSYFKPFTEADVTITPIVGGGTTSNKYIVNLSINAWWLLGTGGTLQTFIKLSHLVSGGSLVLFGQSDYWSSVYTSQSAEYHIEAGNVVNRINVPSASQTVFSFQIKCDVNITMIMPNGTGIVSLMVTEVKG